MKKLRYRGISYESHSAPQVFCRPDRELGATDRLRDSGVICIEPHTEPTDVRTQLAIEQLSWRGIAYYRLISQGKVIYNNRSL